MYFYTKLFFIILTFLSYALTYYFSYNTSLRAINKILVFSLFSLIILSILFQDTIGTTLASLIGVGRGPDAILYLFIILSLSINFLLAKKIINLEDNLRKIVQKISLNENIKN